MCVYVCLCVLRMGRFGSSLVSEGAAGGFVVCVCMFVCLCVCLCVCFVLDSLEQVWGIAFAAGGFVVYVCVCVCVLRVGLFGAGLWD